MKISGAKNYARGELFIYMQGNMKFPYMKIKNMKQSCHIFSMHETYCTRAYSPEFIIDLESVSLGCSPINT